MQKNEVAEDLKVSSFLSVEKTSDKLAPPKLRKLDSTPLLSSSKKGGNLICLDLKEEQEMIDQ